MKNELAIRKPETDLFAIIKTLGLISTEIYKRNEPDVKKKVEIAFEKAFLTFDAILTTFIEFLPIAFLAIKVFINWCLETKVGKNIRLFGKEARNSVVEILETVNNSSRQFVNEIPWKISNVETNAITLFRETFGKFKMELIYLWQFREELVKEAKEDL